LYVDSGLSYLMIILLNDFIRPKSLSTAGLILLYSPTLYGLGPPPFLMLGSISIDSKPLLICSVSYAASA
jgi:hypothetical protein